MYVVKVMHGYIDKTGCRTREKNLDNLLIFKDKKESEGLLEPRKEILNQSGRTSWIGLTRPPILLAKASDSFLSLKMSRLSKFFSRVRQPVLSGDPHVCR